MPAVEALWLDVSGEFFTGSLGLLNVHLEPVLEFRPFCSMIHWTQSMGLCCELHWSTSTNRTQPSDKVHAATKRASVLTCIKNSTHQFWSVTQFWFPLRVQWVLALLKQLVITQSEQRTTFCKWRKIIMWLFEILINGLTRPQSIYVC